MALAVVELDAGMFSDFPTASLFATTPGFAAISSLSFTLNFFAMAAKVSCGTMTYVEAACSGAVAGMGWATGCATGIAATGCAGIAAGTLFVFATVGDEVMVASGVGVVFVSATAVESVVVVSWAD